MEIFYFVGEVLGLLGPNGAGKSTTINLITGDIEPSAGQVNVTLTILTRTCRA